MEQIKKNIEISIFSKLNTEELGLDFNSINPEHWKVFTDTLKTTIEEVAKDVICRDIQDVINGLRNGEYNIPTEVGLMSIVNGKLIVEAEDEE
jgi:hypothetical protein